MPATRSRSGSSRSSPSPRASPVKRQRTTSRSPSQEIKTEIVSDDNHAASHHDNEGGSQPISRCSSVIDHGLTDSEEEYLQTWILSMDDDHLLPRPATVRDMANLLLEKREGPSPQPVNIEWANDYIQRMHLLESSFASQAEREKAENPDPRNNRASFRQSSPKPPATQGPHALESALANKLLQKSKASMNRTIAEYRNIIELCEHAIDDTTMMHRDQEYIIGEIDHKFLAYETELHKVKAELRCVQGHLDRKNTRYCGLCGWSGHDRRHCSLRYAQDTTGKR